MTKRRIILIKRMANFYLKMRRLTKEVSQKDIFNRDFIRISLEIKMENCLKDKKN